MPRSADTNEKRTNKLSVFNRAVLWANYIAILALLAAVAAKYVSPALFWIPAFFGLAFPHLFIINCLFIVYWLALLKPVGAFGLIAIAAGIPTAFRYVQFSVSAGKPENNVLKVTSFNCMLFDLYNWVDNEAGRNRILGSLNDIHPDILCLQEFYTSEEAGDFNNTDTLSEMLKLPYVHLEFTTTLRDHDHWGIGTFSRYPIVRQGKIAFNTRSNNICIFTDILINKDTIRVYNLHLQSISFSEKDNRFLGEVATRSTRMEEMETGKSILRRLKRAFVKRTAQVDMVAVHIGACRYSIILCGDFNDTAASYAYERLSKNLNDAFIEKGFGLGKTYAGKWPQFRIDYILHSPELRCSDYRRARETYTDHYPITAYFQYINPVSDGNL